MKLLVSYSKLTNLIVIEQQNSLVSHNQSKKKLTNLILIFAWFTPEMAISKRTRETLREKNSRMPGCIQNHSDHWRVLDWTEEGSWKKKYLISKFAISPCLLQTQSAIEKNNLTNNYERYWSSKKTNFWNAKNKKLGSRENPDHEKKIHGKN